MKVSGYQIREAIRRFELVRDTSGRLFKKSLHVFEGEEKVQPQGLMEKFQQAEEAVVILQVAQQKYNLAVMVDVQGSKMTLCSAVKRLGGAGRAEKMWRDSIVEREDRYGGTRELERQKDTLMATKVLKVEDATKAANKAAGWAGALRAAVAMGNSTVIEIEGLDGYLLGTLA